MDLVTISILGFAAGIGLGYLKHKIFGTGASVGTGAMSSQGFSDYNDGFTIDGEFHHLDEPMSTGCGVNPATGLPMLGDSMVDVGGSPCGVDLHSDTWSDTSLH